MTGMYTEVTNCISFETTNPGQTSRFWSSVLVMLQIEMSMKRILPMISAFPPKFVHGKRTNRLLGQFTPGSQKEFCYYLDIGRYLECYDCSACSCRVVSQAREWWIILSNNLHENILSDMVEAVEHPSVRSLSCRLGRFRGSKHVPESEGLICSSWCYCATIRALQFHHTRYISNVHYILNAETTC